MTVFHVTGIPQSQGNKTGFVRGGHVVMREGRTKDAAERVKTWRQSVTDAAAKCANEAVRTWLASIEAGETTVYADADGAEVVVSPNNGDTGFRRVGKEPLEYVENAL